jgi:hypothetical protein
MRIHERFQTKANRDARAKELKAQGYTAIRRSSGPCELHPEYIKDWVKFVDKGFGNTQYKTYFANTYTVDVA